MNVNMYPLPKPKVVAIATDRNLIPTYSSVDQELPVPAPKYGQDFSFGVGRRAPRGESVGTTEAELKPQMEFLLRAFAKKDKRGMAKRLFDKFLAKQPRVFYFEDSGLNAAAAEHDNVSDFCRGALGAPFPFGTEPRPGRTRIHQALRAANWDINRLVAPTDLGVPAFSQGSKMRSTGDFANGLGVMVNGVQHVYVLATHYYYDKSMMAYMIKLKYIFYDVFGLDDDDLREYGATTGGGELSFNKIMQGITAWWQLQHQFGYAPLVTRIVVEKDHVVLAK